MPVTHRMVSAHSDGADPTQVHPSDWNNTHLYDFTITSKSANYGITDADEITHVSPGASNVTITLPTAVGRQGRFFRIKKVDAGVGVVTVATTGGQTIEDSTTYLLTNKWQNLVVYSDGSNWCIDAAN